MLRYPHSFMSKCHKFSKYTHYGLIFDNSRRFLSFIVKCRKTQIDSIIYQISRFYCDIRVIKNVLGCVVFESDHNLLQKSFCKKSETNQKCFCSETLFNFWSHAEIIKCITYMRILGVFVEIYEE